jgi:membrane protein YdbS with pleckstrin-like domain
MSKIYCSNCGKLTDYNANFCRYCGAPQHGEESAIYRAQEAPIRPPTVPSDAAEARVETPKERRLEDEVVPKRHLSPNAIWLFYINYLFKTFIIIPLLIIGTLYEPLVGLILAAYLLVTFLIATLVYNYFYFAVNDDQLEIDYGIIHKRHVSLPFRQVQNVNITRTLIDRALGIARLEIESAGASHGQKRDIIGGTRSKAEAYLPGVSMRDAKHLHDVILQKALHQQNGD